MKHSILESVFCLLLNIILHYVLLRRSDSASPTSAQQEESLESRQTMGPKWAALPLALARHTHYRLGHENTIYIFLRDLFFFFLEGRHIPTYVLSPLLRRKQVVFGWWKGGNHKSKYQTYVPPHPPPGPSLDEIWDTDHYFHGFSVVREPLPN